MRYCFHNRAQQNVEISLVVSLQQPINWSIRKMFRRPTKNTTIMNIVNTSKQLNKREDVAGSPRLVLSRFQLIWGKITINRNFCEKFRKKWNLLMGWGRKCENFKDTGVHDLYLAPTFEGLHHCLVLNWTYLHLNYTMPSSINFFTKLNRSFSLILSRQQTFKKW